MSGTINGIKNPGLNSSNLREEPTNTILLNRQSIKYYIKGVYTHR